METKIKKLDNYGRGITYINSKICFVENALEEETVDIDITVEKKKFLEANVSKYIETSPKRIKPVCKYYLECGGCSLSHFDYSEENKFKNTKLKDLITKFTNLDKKIIKETVFLEDSYYRNKVVFHIKNKKLGLYSKKTNALVEVDECKLLSPNINKLIPILKEVVKNNNIEEITVRVGNRTNETMVIVKGEVKYYQTLENIVDVLVINNKTVSNNKRIKSYIGEIIYYISANAFFQVNTDLTEKLYDEVVKNIQKYQSKNVLDLYCGSGTISLYISKYVDSVIGIEVVKESIEDANINKKINNINNATFIHGRVEDNLSNIKNIDTIIVDPPRNGLGKKTISNIVNIEPSTIIYVSCDAVTLCRDLNVLSSHYDTIYIKPFNMFPRTHHIECACVLKRR